VTYGWRCSKRTGRRPHVFWQLGYEFYYYEKKLQKMLWGAEDTVLDINVLFPSYHLWKIVSEKSLEGFHVCVLACLISLYL
jgi:hypothetical protein